MALLELQFGRIFNRDDGFLVPNVTGKHVQERRLARAGSARNYNVESRGDRPFKYIQHRPGKRLVCQQVVFRDRYVTETSNRQMAAVNGAWRHGRVDSRPLP